MTFNKKNSEFYFKNTYKDPYFNMFPSRKSKFHMKIK